MTSSSLSSFGSNSYVVVTGNAKKKSGKGAIDDPSQAENPGKSISSNPGKKKGHGKKKGQVLEVVLSNDAPAVQTGKKTAVVALYDPAPSQSDRPTEPSDTSDSSQTDERATERTREDSARYATSEDTRTRTESDAPRSLYDPQKFNVIVNLVLNGNPLTATESDDSVQLKAGDQAIELSKEDLKKDPELRRVIREKINEQLKTVALDLSGFKLDFGSFLKAGRRDDSPKFSDPASFIDLALAKILSQRQSLDLQA